MSDHSDLPRAVSLWKQIAASHDFSLIDDLIADDAVFESPVLHTPQVGRELVKLYLSAAVSVLGGPDARFVNQWISNRSAVLELETTVGGLALNAVDILTWDDAGRVTRFKVMARPLKAIQALIAAMAEGLDKPR